MSAKVLLDKNRSSDEILGNVEYHYEFYSRYLKNERDIIVWLPPDYGASYKRYPVLYMHDGQNLFDPATSFIGYDWKVDETILRLTEENLMREIIVVGIYNTRDRLEEYNLFTEKGKQYSSFIRNELKPFIDANYSTFSGKENTAVMGSSLGGLCSFQLIWEHSNIFGKAACLSNSFWVENRAIFKHVSSTVNMPKNIRLYLDCGDEEKELIKDNQGMKKLLHELGYSKKDFMWQKIKGGKHTEYDWAERLHKPLLFLFGKDK